MQVPRVHARLSTFAARFEASQQLYESRAVFKAHLEAHKELRASKGLEAALTTVLAIGNFMNWGSRLGQAAGFRVKSLAKLQVSPCGSCAWIGVSGVRALRIGPRLGCVPRYPNDYVADSMMEAALTAVLAIGKLLNRGSRLVQAAGFRIKSLANLQVSAWHSADVCSYNKCCRHS